jgi:hypothetical protein
MTIISRRSPRRTYSSCPEEVIVGCKLVYGVCLTASRVAGDWHCAYVLLYGPRLLEITDDEEKMVTDN